MTNAVTDVIDALRSIDPNDVNETIKVMGAAADALERLNKPAHEREPPHCSTCDCLNAPGGTPASGVSSGGEASGVSEDPAMWDACDEHETTFPKGDSCPQCIADEPGCKHEKQTTLTNGDLTVTMCLDCGEHLLVQHAPMPDEDPPENR